jgi:hypothetical protein
MSIGNPKEYGPVTVQGRGMTIARVASATAMATIVLAALALAVLSHLARSPGL